MVFHILFLAEWSTYEVRLMFTITCDDEEYIELYTAREIAHHWVKEREKTTTYDRCVINASGLNVIDQTTTSIFT